MEQITVTNISPEDLFARFKNEVSEAVKAAIPNEPNEKLLNYKEACSLFVPVIARKTLRVWTDQGLIPVHRIGNRLFYKQSEILAAAKQVKKFARDKQPIV